MYIGALPKYKNSTLYQLQCYQLNKSLVSMLSAPLGTRIDIGDVIAGKYALLPLTNQRLGSKHGSETSNFRVITCSLQCESSCEGLMDDALGSHVATLNIQGKPSRSIAIE